MISPILPPAGGRTKEGGLLQNPVSSTQVDLGIPANIPTDYVSDLPTRLDVYRRLVSSATPDEVDAMGDELVDRFGTLPWQAQNLLYVTKLKLAAAQANVLAVNQGKPHNRPPLERQCRRRKTGPPPSPRRPRRHRQHPRPRRHLRRLQRLGTLPPRHRRTPRPIHRANGRPTRRRPITNSPRSCHENALRLSIVGATLVVAHPRPTTNSHPTRHSHTLPRHSRERRESTPPPRLPRPLR